MKTIKLSNGKYAMVSDSDYQYLNQFRWCCDKDGYVQRKYNNCRNIYMHREIMNVNGSKILVDHIDGNPSNNQRENLRICTNQQNLCNRPKQSNNTSGYKGVYWRKDKNKWSAQIKVNQKRYFIGYFNKIEDAAMAYNWRALQEFGEFAYLNEIK